MNHSQQTSDSTMYHGMSIIGQNTKKSKAFETIHQAHVATETK